MTNKEFLLANTHLTFGQIIDALIERGMTIKQAYQILNFNKDKVTFVKEKNKRTLKTTKVNIVKQLFLENKDILTKSQFIELVINKLNISEKTALSYVNRHVCFGLVDRNNKDIIKQLFLENKDILTKKEFIELVINKLNISEKTALSFIAKNCKFGRLAKYNVKQKPKKVKKEKKVKPEKVKKVKPEKITGMKKFKKEKKVYVKDTDYFKFEDDEPKIIYVKRNVKSLQDQKNYNEIIQCFLENTHLIKYHAVKFVNEKFNITNSFNYIKYIKDIQFARQITLKEYYYSLLETEMTKEETINYLREQKVSESGIKQIIKKLFRKQFKFKKLEIAENAEEQLFLDILKNLHNKKKVKQISKKFIETNYEKL